MPEPRLPPGATAPSGPPRHLVPAVDEAALAAANRADRLIAAARSNGSERWESFLAPLPDRLRDADVAELRGVALRARAAYGPKDSVRDVLPAEVTEPFVDAVDRLLKVLARRSVEPQ
jgi:hypothetical protein